MSAARQLIRTTYEGAVRGGKEALVTAVVDRWSDQLTQLDWEVTCSGEAPWWKKKLHGLAPLWIFRLSLFKQADLQPFRKGWDGPGPAYGTKGNSKGQGLQCIDKEMAVPVGVPFFLPRLIKTQDGQEILQHLYIQQKEREEQALREEDYEVAGGD